MRQETTTVNIYKFNELSDEAKERAINDYREGEDYQYIYDEASDTLKAFCKLFDIKLKNFDYHDPQRTRVEINIDKDVLALSGLRLQKYLWNNYRNDLYKGKHYSTPGKYVNGKYHYKYRYSNFKTERECVLTGMCYDCSILKDIYEYLDDKKPSEGTDFESLLKGCLDAIAYSVQEEIEAREKDEFIIDEIEANEYEFTENGKMY